MPGTDRITDSQTAAKRSDREHMERVLHEEDVGVLGLAAGDESYVVPVNYTYDRGRILFHCALKGRKLDFIRGNPNVCFVVYRQKSRPAPHTRDQCDGSFESVIFYGVARIVDDVEERRELLNIFQERFVTPENPRDPITLDRAEQCGCVEIRATEMTGRSADSSDKVSWRWRA